MVLGLCYKRLVGKESSCCACSIEHGWEGGVAPCFICERVQENHWLLPLERSAGQPWPSLRVNIPGSEEWWSLLQFPYPAEKRGSRQSKRQGRGQACIQSDVISKGRCAGFDRGAYCTVPAPKSCKEWLAVRRETFNPCGSSRARWRQPVHVWSLSIPCLDSQRWRLWRSRGSYNAEVSWNPKGWIGLAMDLMFILVFSEQIQTQGLIYQPLILDMVPGGNGVGKWAGSWQNVRNWWLYTGVSTAGDYLRDWVETLTPPEVSKSQHTLSRSFSVSLIGREGRRAAFYAGMAHSVPWSALGK